MSLAGPSDLVARDCAFIEQVYEAQFAILHFAGMPLLAGVSGLIAHRHASRSNIADFFSILCLHQICLLQTTFENSGPCFSVVVLTIPHRLSCQSSFRIQGLALSQH
jgi:hypothetical protein